VPVPPGGFYTPMVTLKPGTELVGKYEARRPGEAPRKWVAAKGASKAPAKSVDIIVYSHAVLAENGEDTAGTEWEIITINANPTAENDVPMPPGTLMANHFGASGGTATGMTAEEFEAAMRKSYEYWGDKALAEGC